MNCPKCSRQLNTRNPLIKRLSQRQLGIALLAAMGKTREEIAEAEKITQNNVSSQLYIVRNTLGVRNDVEMTLFLYGLFDQVGELTAQ